MDLENDKQKGRAVSAAFGQSLRILSPGGHRAMTGKRARTPSDVSTMH
jgi:hypothetical protein